VFYYAVVGDTPRKGRSLIDAEFLSRMPEFAEVRSITHAENMHVWADRSQLSDGLQEDGDAFVVNEASNVADNEVVGRDPIFC
jgi:hypothetical protein